MSENIDSKITVKKISKKEYIKTVFSKMYGKEITEEEYDKIFNSIPPMMNPESIEYIVLKSKDEVATALTLINNTYDSRIHSYGKTEELLYISDNSIKPSFITKMRYYDKDHRKFVNKNNIGDKPKVEENIENLVFLIKEYQYDNKNIENNITKFILYFYNKNYKSIRMESVN